MLTWQTFLEKAVLWRETPFILSARYWIERFTDQSFVLNPRFSKDPSFFVSIYNQINWIFRKLFRSAFSVKSWESQIKLIIMSQFGPEKTQYWSLATNPHQLLDSQETRWGTGCIRQQWQLYASLPYRASPTYGAPQPKHRVLSCGTAFQSITS